MESRQINPGLGRADVMLNSFGSCISNAPEEFSWAPKMSMPKIISQPRVLLHQFESRIPFEKLKGFANRHSWWQFNKQMDMVYSNMKFIDFTSMFESNFSNKSLTIHFQPIKLEGVHSIFNFPDKMESILPKAVFKTLQIHFFSPELTRNIKAHANSICLVTGTQSQSSSYINRNQKLNLVEEGNSSLGLKAEVSLPLM